MNSEPDINSIIAETINYQLDKVFNKAAGFIKDAKDTIRLRLFKTSYEQYLSALWRKHSKGKSFFIRNEPVYLYNFYVPLDLNICKNSISSPGLSDILARSNNIVITATAGSGKSIFMRHLLLDALLKKTLVPVYIELRLFNDKSDFDLCEILISELKANGFELDNDYIKKALIADHFVLLLDGFDELSPIQQKKMEVALRLFKSKYLETKLIIASRPDDALTSMQGFTNLSVAPLSLDKACELIERLPFDEEIKCKFIVELKKSLFKQHKFLLSNPLLLSIMLLTYGQGASIPTKMNVFYNQAYDALFQRHDALKSGYKRDRRTNLDVQDFAKIFSAFCMLLYDKRQIRFSRTDALNHINKAKTMYQFDFRDEDFLTDSLQSVCLLVEDGVDITFTHRSFQEYFVAYFIANVSAKKQKEIIKRYMPTFFNDNVLCLLYEMRDSLVKNEVILPLIKKIKKHLGIRKKVGISHFYKFLRDSIDKIYIAENRIAFSHTSQHNLREYFDLYRLLTSESLRPLGYVIQYNREERESLLKKYNGQNLKIKDLTIKDAFVRELGNSSSSMSITAIQKMIDLEKKITANISLFNNTLEDILSKSN